MKRIVHVLFFILIIFIGLFFSQPASAQSVFSYSGTLRNGAGLPIPGAELLMFCGSSQSSAFTGNDGSFILYVPGGMCSLDVNVSSVDPSLAPSIEPSATNISVTGDMVQDLTIPTQTLTVTVIDSLGQPVPNASVGVSNNVLSQPFSLFSGASSNTVIEHTDGRTDTNGVIHLALVPISSITLNAFPPSGSKLTSVSETISFLSTTSVSVTLPPIFSYSGILRNGSGAPISGAELLMFCGSSQSSAFTGNDGSFILYVP
ncbi:hypothetical protein HY031_00130, partial [Candidatus Gottesmanbacteria bacterium]|nr:hypothetical protein [Candidatus Gottesmanbacteria bacterium]